MEVKHEVTRSWLQRYPSNTFLASEIFLGLYLYMGVLLVPLPLWEAVLLIF
jgi:hypothetical protein